MNLNFKTLLSILLIISCTQIAAADDNKEWRYGDTGRPVEYLTDDEDEIAGSAPGPTQKQKLFMQDRRIVRKKDKEAWYTAGVGLLTTAAYACCNDTPLSTLPLQQCMVVGVGAYFLRVMLEGGGRQRNHIGVNVVDKISAAGAGATTAIFLGITAKNTIDTFK